MLWGGGWGRGGAWSSGHAKSTADPGHNLAGHRATHAAFHDPDRQAIARVRETGGATVAAMPEDHEEWGRI